MAVVFRGEIIDMNVNLNTYQRVFEQCMGGGNALALTSHVKGPKLLALGPANHKSEGLCKDFWDNQAALKNAIILDSPNVKKISAAIKKAKKVLKEEHNITIGNLDYKKKNNQLGLYKREYAVNTALWFNPGEPPTRFLSQNPEEFAENLPKSLQVQLMGGINYLSNLIKGQKVKLLLTRQGNEIILAQRTAAPETAIKPDYIFNHEHIKDVIPKLRKLILVGDVETKADKLILSE